MQSNFRALYLFLMLLPWFAGGCASDRPPSGGPANTSPLQVMFDPPPSSVNVSANRLRLTFNHYVAGQQLLDALVFSPSIGEFDIALDGRKAELVLDKPLAPQQTYIITLDKNLKDIQGRTLPAPFTTAFSTGAVIDNGTISGKVINYDFSPANNALILAFAERTDTHGQESLTTRKPDYLIQAETSGAFSFNHIANGLYRIIAVNDQNNDLRYTPGAEETGLCSSAFVPTGSSDLLFRFSGVPDSTRHSPVAQAPAMTTTGSISGTCFAPGQYLVIEASSATASCRTTASRSQNGTFYYSFPEIPPGRYTISAYVLSGNKKPDSIQQWNPGSIEPFQPAEPFGYYPEKVTVRAGWPTEHIDIHIKNAQ